MMKTDVKKWLGSTPTNCDLCKAPIDNTFVDGKTCYGPWAIMCITCHTQVGCGLGTGKGQKYEKQREDWVKVAG